MVILSVEAIPPTDFICRGDCSYGKVISGYASHGEEGSKLEVFDDRLEGSAADQKLFNLVGRELRHNVSLNCAVADEGGKGEADVTESVFAVEHCGDHQSRAIDAIECLTNGVNGIGNRVVGAALAADDLRA